ncbi:MAG: glycosyltransferase family 4 protein [Cyclobacteriaceae bacterium]
MKFLSVFNAKNAKNKTNILFICPYPVGQSPSQRFRFEQYFELLRSNDYHFIVRPFISESTWEILYKQGHYLKKALGIIRGFIKRFLLIPAISQYDIVFIHREATPFGPPWIEWIAAKIFKKRIIYDFDDAIWMKDESNERRLISLLKCRKKIKSIIKWSWKISCGNQFLKDYASQYNINSFLNPTTIDTENLHKIQAYGSNKKNNIVIGWTGSHSTVKYLDSLYPVFLALSKKHGNIKFIVIANVKPTISLETLHFIEWNIQTEIEDLAKIDIGTMPLPDDEWSKGKCGFKLLQYMALGIPCIGSKVGANLDIVEDGINGFLCSSEEAWFQSLEKLIKDENLRSTIGRNGRKTIVNKYSVQSNEGNFLKLFNL